MKRVKTIDEIYGEVKDYDLVLTNDVALSTALNGRIDSPRIGDFAYTPRNLAVKLAASLLDEPLHGDLGIISAVREETGYDLKFVHSEIERIRDIRRHTAEVEKHLYSKSSREVYRSYRALPTLEKVMEMFRPEESPFFSGKRVAVVDVRYFDDLDKHFIPLDFESVSIYRGDESYDIPVIHEIGNNRQIAENIVDLIRPEDASNTAIVLNVSSSMADAVRSALYRRKLPFKNDLAVRDLSQIRDYLQFVSLSLDYDTVRVRHVREIFSNYGGNLDEGKDVFLLSKMVSLFDPGREPENIRLAGLMRNVRDITYRELADSIVDPDRRPQVTMLLEELGLSDERITSKRLGEISYVVNNIADLRHNEQIPESEKKGVLLVDCHNSAFVDRSFVIYAGMGEDWSTGIAGRKYVDRIEEANKNMHRFETLLQQGTCRIYAVNSIIDGREAIPCQMFNHILGSAKMDEEYDDYGSSFTVVKTFADIQENLLRGRWVPDTGGSGTRLELPRPETVHDDDMVFSKSSYDSYRKCPRGFMFSRLIRNKDNQHTLMGSIIHQFAEFYLCYPEEVRKNGPEVYIDFLSERYSSLSYEQMRDVDESTIRMCVTSIMGFLETVKHDGIELDMQCSAKDYPNIFMERFGFDMCSSSLEKEVFSEGYPLKGSLDVLSEETSTVIDYKTGRPKSLDDIVKSWEQPRDGQYDCQALVYLDLLRGAVGEDSASLCRFLLFFARDNDVAIAQAGMEDPGENTREIVLLRRDMPQLFREGDPCIVSQFNQKNKAAEAVTTCWRAFVDLLDAHGWDRCGEWPGDVGMVNSLLELSGTSGAKSNIENCTRILRRAAEIVGSGCLISGRQIMVTPAFLERFLEEVRTAHDLVMEQMETGFPAEPCKSCRCRDCDYRSVCMGENIGAEGSE